MQKDDRGRELYADCRVRDLLRHQMKCQAMGGMWSVCLFTSFVDQKQMVIGGRSIIVLRLYASDNNALRSHTNIRIHLPNRQTFMISYTHGIYQYIFSFTVASTHYKLGATSSRVECPGATPSSLP